jgi:oxalate decarboxylase
MQHYYSLGKAQPQLIRNGGQRTDAKVQQLPSLKGLSLSLLELKQGGVREPHWHPNAHELGYVLEGNGKMTIFGHRAAHDTFSLEPGAIAFVPMGYMHHIENTGDKPLKMAIGFSHENPEDLDLSKSVGAMPSHILSATAGNTSSFYDHFTKSHGDTFIGERKEHAELPISYATNRYKLSLENSNPQVNTPGGTVKMSNSFILPSLEDIVVYAVLLKPKGAREPHWHPNAHELNYLTRGKARITLLSPNGDVETFDMAAGDMSFMPQGYLHYIENIGDEDAHFIIYFTNTAPSDIGLSGCFGAYSDPVIASALNINSDLLEGMPKHQHDLMIIAGGG